MTNGLWITFGVLCFVVGGFGLDIKVGNPDDNARIERPCPTYDLNCIRDFFRNHARCRKTYGPVPDSFRRAQSNIYFPGANLSITIIDQKISGLNGRIEEFYINQETDNLVLAVEFSLRLTSDKVFFIFSRRAKEPVITTAAYDAVFGPTIITAVIPQIDDLQLEAAESTAYSTSATAPFVVTPTFIASTGKLSGFNRDPQAAESVATALSDIPTAIQEMFFTDSTFIISTYIQYVLCDYGVKVP